MVSVPYRRNRGQRSEPSSSTPAKRENDCAHARLSLASSLPKNAGRSTEQAGRTEHQNGNPRSLSRTPELRAALRKSLDETSGSPGSCDSSYDCSPCPHACPGPNDPSPGWERWLVKPLLLDLTETSLEGIETRDSTIATSSISSHSFAMFDGLFDADLGTIGASPE